MSSNEFNQAAKQLKAFAGHLTTAMEFLEDAGAVERAVAEQRRVLDGLKDEEIQARARVAAAHAEAEVVLAEAKTKAEGIVAEAQAALVEGERQKRRGNELREAGMVERQRLTEEGKLKAAAIVAEKNTAIAERDAARAATQTEVDRLEAARKSYEAFLATHAAVKVPA